MHLPYGDKHEKSWSGWLGEEGGIQAGVGCPCHNF